MVCTLWYSLRFSAWLVLFVCLSTQTTQVQAQTQPLPTTPEEAARQQRIPGQQEQKREQERIDAMRQRQEATPDVKGSESGINTQRLPTAEAPCFPIRQISFTTGQGDTSGTSASAPDRQTSRLMDSAQRALAGPNQDDSPLRKCIGAQGVNLLIQRAQDALINQGYVTTRVLAPPQDLSTGQLQLAIIPGRVHAIVFDTPPGTTPPRATTINTIPTDAGRILNLRDIEQGLENLKRVPTAEADIQIAPAPTGAPDQSDLQVRLQQATPLRVSLGMDDSGSKSSGKTQGNATLSVDNPLGLSDLFYITWSHALRGADLGQGGVQSPTADYGTRGLTVHWSVPLGYWLLSATASNSTYWQSVAGANQDYIYSGTSENTEVKLSRIVWRDAFAKTTMGLKAWQRKSNNYIDDTEVEVQRRVVGGWQLDAGHKLSLGDATLEANLSWKRGTGDFDTLAAPEELFGEGTSRFSLAALDASATIPFKAGGYALRYSPSLRVQDNFTRLTPQDRFSIGGRYSVRGFDGESSLSGERGWTLRNDLSLGLGQSAHELYLGMDAGEVGGPASTQLLGNSLSGAVIGIRGSFKPTQPFTGTLQYDLFAGGPLSKPAGFRTADSTVGFSLNLSF